MIKSPRAPATASITSHIGQGQAGKHGRQRHGATRQTHSWVPLALPTHRPLPPFLCGSLRLSRPVTAPAERLSRERLVGGTSDAFGNGAHTKQTQATNTRDPDTEQTHWMHTRHKTCGWVHWRTKTEAHGRRYADYTSQGGTGTPPDAMDMDLSRSRQPRKRIASTGAWHH